ncbi:SpoIIE family protein phosphatase [Streptomyces sp. PT12]|uniref:SpoIIE family protein phosphatase n=1 Tax=Streptomyces sp. PT12 TaxID=1510197 RepID=UPI000DE3806B|nr:SpoIIE family protein phosphatase [Streptomyces sp. PT12]RBM24348.1 histidine kinase [Streptomyces sp. PT12]
MKWAPSWFKVPRRGSSRAWLGRLVPRSVAAQTFAVVLAVLLLLMGAMAVVLVLDSHRDSEEDARARAKAVAVTFAQSPDVLRGLESADPPEVLQPLAERVRRQVQIDYVVVTDPEGIRFSHPDPKFIGERVDQSLSPATKGRAFTDHVPGASIDAPSIRAAAPIKDAGGSVVGIVSVGVTTTNVRTDVSRELPLIAAITAFGLLAASGAVALLSRRLRHQTHGLGTAELTRLYEHHDAVLHSVREGILLTDRDGLLVLANDEARRLLGLAQGAEGRHVTDLGLGPEITGLLASGREATDEVIEVGERPLAVNQRPTTGHGQRLGSVVTIRDTTELRALAGVAQEAQHRLRLLYDASVAMGTSMDVRRTARELVEVTVGRLADAVAVDLQESVLTDEEPAQAPDRMERVARSTAEGRDVELPPPPDEAARRALASGPTEGAEGRVLCVPLRVSGVLLGQLSLVRGPSGPPFAAEDRSLAQELAGHAAVSIDNGRRYSREHATALALQRSLLPSAVPEQSAVEAAYRYLPAAEGAGGAGGDWFDIIPLSSARVALVVGDVVGHGLDASATMGRLRTAVHNLSSLDLPPDQLLANLDDLVRRLDQESALGAQGGGIAGATCLYAIHDPVSGRCSLARAGHLAPVVIRVGGGVEFIEVPAGPPLGLGGFPFEAVDIPLRRGDRLVLYTDGLIAAREQDPDVGLARLERALGQAGSASPEETCRIVMDQVLPERPTDDVALLVARANELSGENVASWDVPKDPAVVADMRAAVTRCLAEWGLGEAAFTTELVVSELLSNAIRHASGPIRVRLLRDRALVCEVADGSTTAPHLRSAKANDEGGRGLFLVAQAVSGWGTRYIEGGKIIWTEQPLPGPSEGT